MCEYCKDFEGEKLILTEHQQYCDMKPKACKYCELAFPAGQKFEEHVRVCGSKTFKCEDCGQQIKKSEQSAHKISGSCEMGKETQRERVNRELLRFQEEEKKKLTNKNTAQTQVKQDAK